MQLTFNWVDEERPGPQWLGRFDRAWPAYRSWFLGEGDEARPGIEACRDALIRHMPEIAPLWERLGALAGDDVQVARMLSLVDPAPYVTGCSQAVRSGKSPLLVRNYDYRPDACEGLFLRSRWHETAVIASSDCLWGALDGINEHGLCVALSFGGSRAVGPGFGIPLILRYILEFCRTVRGAVDVLRRVPCHMTYNVSLVDASGEYRVAFLAPGRDAHIVRQRVSTNHQNSIEWSEYAEATRSAERFDYLERQLRRRVSDEALIAGFLEPPLHVSEYEKGYGTLYTVAYRPESGSADFLWPHVRVGQTLEDFTDTEIRVTLAERA